VCRFVEVRVTVLAERWKSSPSIHSFFERMGTRDGLGSTQQRLMKKTFRCIYRSGLQLGEKKRGGVCLKGGELRLTTLSWI
jgi:hypothetical protein